MESLRVKDLQEIAKSKGLKGFWRLRKSELISFIKDSKSASYLLDEETPSNLSTPTLIPTQYVPPTTTSSKKKTTQKGLTDWERWLIESVPEPPKESINETKRKILAAYDQEIQAPKPRLTSSALDMNVQRWFISGEGYRTPEAFLTDTEDDVKNIVDSVPETKKTYTTLKCVLVKIDRKTKDRIYTDFNGRSKTHTISTQLGDTYEEMKGKMIESLSKFSKEGSGWQLYSIVGLDISIVKFNPLSGSGYSELPLFIRKKKAVINMKNEDNQCFKWAVTRALNPAKNNSERVTKELREQSKKYDWSGITFPTKVKDIHIWEKNNKDKFKINVFGYDEESKKVYTIKMHDNHTSVVLDEESEFISLFLHDDNHFCVVKNLGRLVSSQLSNHEHKKHFCLSCRSRHTNASTWQTQSRTTDKSVA